MILEEEGKNGAYLKRSGKLRTGSRTKSTIEDLGKPEKFQSQSCLKHILEGLIFCACGICLRPEEKHIERIKTRFQANILPYHLPRVNYSRGKRHGEAQWQRDQSKAMNARRGAGRKGHDSIVIKWQENDKYRNSQKAHGWSEEFCRNLDHLTTIDISYTAPWHQRHRYENIIMLVCSDDDRPAGPRRARKDLKPTTQTPHKRTTKFPHPEERRSTAKTIR